MVYKTIQSGYHAEFADKLDKLAADGWLLFYCQVLPSFYFAVLQKAEPPAL